MKKVKNTKLSALILVFVLALNAMLIAGCGGNTSNNESSAESGNNSSATSDNTAESSNASESSESSEANDESSDTEYGVSGDESVSTDESTDVSTDVSDDTSSDDPENSDDPDTSTDEEDERIGSGTEADPYIEMPNAEMKLSVTVSAKDSDFYGIYRVGSMILTIKDSDAYVVYNGKEYTAKNGKVTLEIEGAMPSDAIVFEIGNKGSSEKEFELVFTNPEGSYQNPTMIDDIEDDFEISLEEGNQVGHYYKYYAEKDGTLLFEMTASVDSMMSVTNNRNSAQRTTEADGSVDGDVKYVEIEVLAGDEIMIIVGALPNKRGKYPASDINWSAEYK